MPKYVIERELPGAGSLSKDQLHAISKTSCDVLGKLGPQIQWVESYVTDDKIYCIYRAPNEELVRERSSILQLPNEKPAHLDCGRTSVFTIRIGARASICDRAAEYGLRWRRR